MHPAVALLVQDCGAHAELVIHDGAAGRRIQRVGAEIAEAGGDVALTLGEAGVLRIEADGAAGCVLAVQRALRAAQHLDAIEVVDLQRLHGADRFVHLIHVHRDRAALILTVVLRRDAAQCERRLRLGAVRRVEQHVRHAGRDVAGLAHAVLGQVGAGERRDRQRYVLQPLDAALRRHDDFVKGALGGVRGERQERAAHEAQDRETHGETHGVLPGSAALCYGERFELTVHAIDYRYIPIDF